MEKHIRDKIADLIKDKIQRGTITDYGDDEYQDEPHVYVHFQTYLDIADAIIPMVKKYYKDKKKI